MGDKKKTAAGTPSPAAPRKKRLDKKLYETELARLQIELVKLQEWAGRVRRVHAFGAGG